MSKITDFYQGSFFIKICCVKVRVLIDIYIFQAKNVFITTQLPTVNLKSWKYKKYYVP